MKHIKQFFRCIRVLGLDTKYRELAQRLTPDLVPLQCDIALHHILAQDHPQDLEHLIFPFGKATSESAQTTFNPEQTTLDPDAGAEKSPAKKHQDAPLSSLADSDENLGARPKYD